MENHPVPKNVLTVEFKLFGPLTVKQFARLLGVATGCLVLYIIPIPKLISIPTIIVVAILGTASALLEGFDVKIMGMLKAIFTSTQYVWKNEHDVPEVLREELKKEEKTQAKKTLKSSQDAEELNELSIDKILDARAKAQNLSGDGATPTKPKIANAMVSSSQNANSTYEKDDLESDNFAQLYKQTYGETTNLDDSTRRRSARELLPPVQKASGLASTNTPADLMQSGQNMQTVVQTVRNNAPRPQMSQPETTQVIVQQLSDEEKAALITKLTGEVNELRSLMQTSDPEARKEITNAIKDKFGQLQTLIGKKGKEAADATGVNAIFGVVVTNAEQPIPGANVGMISEEDPSNLLASTQTGNDGRFKLDLKELSVEKLGNVVIRVAHPQFSFPDFKINPSQQQLPAYKFKAK